ncbi:MAG TPA: helix-turn-helix transcriptional regulator [Pyrinomonadaceae bacterium]|jgi:transcriptional regulator with XRE-family HTH domain
MGKGRRERPAYLGDKLAEIRRKLALSQNGMLRYLGLSDKLTREELSAYERGVREPTLLTLLKYAQAAGVYVDVLIDDGVSLPDEIPSTTKHEGIGRSSTIKRKNKY